MNLACTGANVVCCFKCLRQWLSEFNIRRRSRECTRNVHECSRGPGPICVELPVTLNSISYYFSLLCTVKKHWYYWQRSCGDRCFIIVTCKYNVAVPVMYIFIPATALHCVVGMQTLEGRQTQQT